MTTVYVMWWLGQIGHNWGLWFYLLLFGELYHVYMAISFWLTVGAKKEINDEESKIGDKEKTNQRRWVDIFITVCGEPVEIVKKTALAAKKQDYSRVKVYILNDGKVAKKENWEEIELMAKEIGVKCITREMPGGAKAGNINHALGLTSGELVAVLDADMIPANYFISRLVSYFEDEKLGFVQSPQYYGNYKLNEVSRGAWEQQRFFFGTIMAGKNNHNAAFICGTNFLIRRKALLEAGGMVEDNIAEDFLTSVYVHQKGWKSKYCREILCQGLAPEDMMSYYKQQMRWARGSLEMLLGHNPIGKRGLSWEQKREYLSSALYYFNGVIVLIDILMPLLFLWLGVEPVTGSSATFALFFLPFMFLNLYTLSESSGGRLTFRAVSFSQSSFVLQLQALVSMILGQKMTFSVTAKQKQTGNYLSLAYPHIMYIILAIGGTIWALNRDGFNPSVATNVAWAIFNAMMFLPYIMAAYDWEGWRRAWRLEQKLAVEWRKS
jgi:cellulose synthase (UDP-forming)